MIDRDLRVIDLSASLPADAARVMMVALVREARLPPGPSAKGKCLFALIVADSIEPGVGQYVSNVQRADMIRLLRETADRLESREDIPR